MYKLGDLFDQPRLVNLIRDLGNDNGVFNAVAASDLIDDGAGTHLDNAATRLVRTTDLFAAVDKTGGRKVGAGDDLDEFINCDSGIFNKLDRRL